MTHAAAHAHAAKAAPLWGTGTLSEKEYTPEQAAAVKRIRKLESYYEILDVARDASDADIKKAYKRVRA